MIEGRTEMEDTPARALALGCLEAGISAGDPESVLADRVAHRDDVLRIDDRSYDLAAASEVVVLGGGKAAARQAMALDRLLGDRIDRGVVVAPDAKRTVGRIEVLPADHPIPSDRGVASTARLLEVAESADRDALVIVLVSGGGSAILPAPASGVSLDELRTVTEALLECGATIDEVNAVRKHLSAIKGGWLARRAAPARVVSLIMSDVVGDDLSVIASGPTVPDPTTFADAVAVLERYGIDVPDGVARRLRAGCEGEIEETPKPGDAAFDRVDNHLVADGATAIRAAESFLADREHRALRLSSRIRGEAREAAKTHVAIAEEMQASGRPAAPPAVLLSAGETTVTVGGGGTGGPNLEFSLSAALEIDAGVTVAAVDTDGIDGAAPAAGALVDHRTVDDRRDALDALEANDAFPYLDERGETIVTGPTGTNLNDLRVLVVDPPTA